ncbi:16S rRNA (guanine(527)-N(7))-methyltransferase RsmG [Salinifilum ghardaiensis]
MGTVTAAEGASQEVTRRVFGDRAELAERFVDMLTEQGVLRGLIGPREIDRLWERHVWNSAVLAELLPPRSWVVDVGSGAGLPGIPLALARPDLEITLLEPMARRVDWLSEVVADLALETTVVRGRAEEKAVRERMAEQDVATARALAPLGRLAQWCLPLVRSGGRVLALKGASAGEELERDSSQIRAAGGSAGRVLTCGADVLDQPTTVVEIERTAEAPPKKRRGRSRSRKDRGR